MVATDFGGPNGPRSKDPFLRPTDSLEPNWATKRRLKLPISAQIKGAGICHFVAKVGRPIKIVRKKRVGKNAKTQKLAPRKRSF